MTGVTVDDVLRTSRIVVCVYPETTFAEAMAADVVTILLYPPEVYERHAVAAPLLAILRAAKIVFHDADAAAAHLNAIWSDPDAWWDSAPVRAARAEFRRQAIDVDGDWLGRWTDFLRNQLSARPATPTLAEGLEP